jgi:predicted dehydrogenase
MRAMTARSRRCPSGIIRSVSPTRSIRVARANYRTAGLADMAQAIVEGRPHRCSLGLAIHAVDVMTSILKSGETGHSSSLTTTCDGRRPLSPDAARKLLG